MLARWSCCDRNQANGKYLILRRSAEPSFYKAGGGAKFKSYGAGRRSLHGIEEGQAKLEALGVPSLVYEPGIHNLACQINHFSACAGVIGVRQSRVYQHHLDARQQKDHHALVERFPQFGRAAATSSG